MSSKKSGTNLVLSGITVAERLVTILMKAIIQAFKWLWQAGNWMHREYINLRAQASGGVQPPVWEKILVAFGIFVIIFVFLRYVLPLMF